MNLGQIVAAIQRVLKDPSILRAEIVDEVNEQQLIQCRSVNIPTLIATEDITIGASGYTEDLPATFHHSLLSADSLTNDSPITIRTNTKTLYDGFDWETEGTIEECAEQSGVLHVRPLTSESETVRVRFYRKPVDMVLDADVPDGLPAELHKKLLVSTVCAEKLPETDLDPLVIKTLYDLHSLRAAQGNIALRQHFKFAPGHTPKARRSVQEF